MTEADWDDIERRLVGAWPWPTLDDERRAIYRAALSDLDPAAVLQAIDEMTPTHRDAMPLPQMLRDRARAGAPEFRDAPPPLPPHPGWTPATAVDGVGRPAPQGPPGMAVASLVLGVCGWVVAPWVGGILAIVFGAVALSQLRASGRTRGRVMALWGLWLGIGSVVAWTALVVVAAIVDDDDDDAAVAVARLTATALGRSITG